jgi:periplasmic protein CpxP/Spy
MYRVGPATRLFRYCAVATLWTSLPIAVCSGGQADSREANAIKAGGTPYFTTKMENLTTKLDLTPDQQAKLKPIALQEVGLLEQMRGNSGYSLKEKLARLEQIVRDSDKQMRPWLSAEQWDKLQALRKDQKERLKQYAKQQ